MISINDYADLFIKVPAKILSNIELSFNEKIILALDYTFSLKKGFNSLSNVQIGNLFNLHPNIVGYCRKNLLNNHYIIKEKRSYILTEKLDSDFVSSNDKRTIYIPFEIYSNCEINTGAKLLWGEYNSISGGEKYYYASRDFTAKRLNASVESITNWTKKLDENKFLELYSHKIGYCTKQKIIVTCKFRLDQFIDYA